MPDLSAILAQPTTWLSASLMLLALWMVASHYRHWNSADKAAARGELPQAEHHFAWRQYRRRVQTSGMMISLAVFIFCSIFIRDPLLIIFYWLGVLALLLWVVLLALADLFASRQHYGRISRDHLAEQARLKAELHRLVREAEVGEEPEADHGV